MDMNRGNIRVDGSKSKNFFTLDDPKKISKEQYKLKFLNTPHNQIYINGIVTDVSSIKGVKALLLDNTNSSYSRLFVFSNIA